MKGGETTKKPRRGRFNLRRGGAHNLKLARYKSNLSQADVAEQLGVHTNTISSWENGLTAPSIYQAYDLARIYGTTVTDLFSDYDAL